MHENTPPRPTDIEEEFDDDVIILENPPPEDDDLEEVTLQQLEMGIARLESDDEENEYDPVQDDAVLSFSLHEGAVFGCALHPDKPWAATGSEDDCVYLWHIETGEQLQQIKEHKDTVTDVHFSSDGYYLATGDMSGFLMVHKLQEVEGSKEHNNSNFMRKIWEFTIGDMTWLRWHRAANVLLAGSENGEVYIWRMPSGDCKILPGTGLGCGIAELAHDGKKLLTAYTSGPVKLWDVKSCTVLMEVNEQHPMGHPRGATALACERDSPLYMTGDADGKILFITNSGPVGCVKADGYVESIAFSPCSDLKIAASATLEGQIAIWDYAKYTLRTLCAYPEDSGGITKIKFLSDYTLLVATIKGDIYAYDVRTGFQKFNLSGHLAEVYDFCYDPRESILVSVSEDCTAKVFRVPPLGE